MKNYKIGLFKPAINNSIVTLNKDILTDANWGNKIGGEKEDKQEPDCRVGAVPDQDPPGILERIRNDRIRGHPDLQGDIKETHHRVRNQEPSGSLPNIGKALFRIHQSEDLQGNKTREHKEQRHMKAVDHTDKRAHRRIGRTGLLKRMAKHYQHNADSLTDIDLRKSLRFHTYPTLFLRQSMRLRL